MPNPLRKLAHKLHLPALFPSVEQQELAYLNAAETVVDLEMRQREVDRGMFRRNAGFY